MTQSKNCINIKYFFIDFLFIRFLDENDSTSFISTSFMSTNELRLELRRRDIEIVKLREAFQEAEQRNINQRQEILKGLQESALVKRESDQKFFEESQDRQKNYFEKKVNQIK